MIRKMIRAAKLSSALTFALALLVSAESFAAEAGLVTVRPTALYDSHSERSRPVWILSGGHPVRMLTGVTGWHKVETHRPEVAGWVRASETRAGRWMVVIATRAAVKAEPSLSAADAMIVPRGAVLESLSPVPFCGGGARGCWHHVAHPDGETGHIRAADVWRNF